eukprot:778341-Pyramimonas_sp.AAC.1
MFPSAGWPWAESARAPLSERADVLADAATKSECDEREIGNDHVQGLSNDILNAFMKHAEALPQ